MNTFISWLYWKPNNFLLPLTMLEVTNNIIPLDSFGHSQREFFPKTNGGNEMVVTHLVDNVNQIPF